MHYNSYMCTYYISKIQISQISLLGDRQVASYAWGLDNDHFMCHECTLSLAGCHLLIAITSYMHVASWLSWCWHQCFQLM